MAFSYHDSTINIVVGIIIIIIIITMYFTLNGMNKLKLKLKQNIESNVIKRKVANMFSPWRRSSEHIYSLASAAPSARDKLVDMFFPVQFIVFRHE